MTIIFYRDIFRYDVRLTDGKTVELGTNYGFSEPIFLKLDHGKVYYQAGEQLGKVTDGVTIRQATFYLMPDTRNCYDPLTKADLLIGSQKGADFYWEKAPADLLLKKEDGIWQLICLRGKYHLNGVLKSLEQVVLRTGDELSFGEKSIKIFPDEIQVQGEIRVSQALVARSVSYYDFYEDYPDYHRSPRIIYRSSEDKVLLNAPSKEPTKPKDELLKLILPPLLMVGVTALISIIQPRGLYIIATMAMSLVTTIFSVQGYFKNRKHYKEELRERVTAYKAYLSDKSVELTRLAKAQKEGQLYHYPAITTLDGLAQGYSHRIYEKTPLHFDFLHYRLGLGQVPTSYQLSYSQTERSGIKDPLEAEGYELYTNNRQISGMPIVANLSHGPVGYIGPRHLVLEQLQLLVNQLALFHSYHDVQFITIMPEEEKAQWDWMRWLPHATLQEMNVRGFVYNQRTRDQVLNSLNQILKLRKTQTEDKTARESSLFSPHYVVLVTDEKLILDHVIMEFFTEDPTELGCSLIFVQDVMSSLSENIKTIVNIKDRNTGQLVMEEGQLRDIDFALDHFPEDYDKESISRRLAPLNHLQNLKSSIPDTVTFMEMYGAERFEDLEVEKRWESHAPYKSLSVPLGLRGQDDIVYLNLHEKAHGPHGLVAGTTGSGKSEVIQSYILSLAVNFHPHDVAFLLIDYKGGGMANLFKDLPHLLGTITNLDGAQSMRALVSINAELKRRQRLFAQADVNHINQYQKKYKRGEVSEPMPHLFLISDEFAELKQNQPDFMKELVSTARIGRSLGIHLILATQKPSGVVDDQIWSNSRFKLALKVADRSDSMEMLKTPDASEITQAGRAYLQVGNNEVYELFQSAWSGADYQPDKDDQGIEDHTIYAINSLGQYELLNEDLSGLDQAEDIRQVPTELDAIVTNLKHLTEARGIKALPQPWLPPLEKEIFVQDLRQGHFKELWGHVSELVAKIGTVDIPSQQAQVDLEHDFDKDGHIAVFSSPGMGKSTFLRTLTMDLARQLTPEQLHYYLLDFGTNGLLALRGLPHVADYMMVDDVEKIQKLSRRLMDEIKQRKKLFSQYSVANAQMYRRASNDSLPNIVMILDGYDAIKGTPTELVVDSLLQLIAREGASLGIYLALTAARFGAMRAALTSNIKAKIALKLNDDSEARTIVGRTSLIVEDIPGRGLVMVDEPETFQVALPTYGKDEIEMIDGIKDEAQAMSNNWTGLLPEGIPVVPEQLTSEQFMTLSGTKKAIQSHQLPIGIEFENVQTISLPLERLKHMMLLTEKETTKTTLLNHLLRTLVTTVPQEQIHLLDFLDEYQDFSGQVNEYYHSESDYGDYLTDLKELIMQARRERRQLNQIVFISDIGQFITASNISDNDFAMIYEESQRVGLHFIYSMTKVYSQTINPINRYLKGKADTAIIGMKMTNQTIFTRSQTGPETELAVDEVYLHYRDAQTKLKITRGEV